MANPYSMDIRNRVILKHNEGKSAAAIADDLCVKKTFVYDTIRLFKTTGSVAPKPHTGGRKPAITEDILLQIKALILETPDITLQEIKDTLGIRVAISRICDAINHRLKLRYKKNPVRHRAKGSRSTSSP